jgi:futalosine hydrolase
MPPRRVLVVTAVAAERDALLAGAGAHGAVVIAGGIGPAAGVATAVALARSGAPFDAAPFDAVVCAGIAGGFAGRAAPGDVVVADRIVAADLGAQDVDGGFLPLDELGLGSPVACPDAAFRDGMAGALVTSLGPARVVRGTVACVSTVTGTARRAAELAARWSPAAEAMEGYPVALAAAAFGVPFGEIRAVSNPVGPRDRASWDLPAALTALTAVGAALFVSWT